MDPLSHEFCRRYLESGVWMWTTWLGTQVCKCPLDLWLYQELITRQRPDVIIETGTWAGGSALYFASVLDLLGSGRVITIDLKHRTDRPIHPRITYVTGSSTDPEVVKAVTAMTDKDDAVMVTLDSDHGKDHVLTELRTYAGLVSPGSYLIAEDTAATAILEPEAGAGPAEAVTEFLAENADFEFDAACEKFLMTWHPGGFLRRLPSGAVA